MKAADWTLVVVAAGLVLFAVSFVYPQWSGSGKQQWTATDAEEYQQLSRQMHGMDYQFAAQRAKDPNARPSAEFARLSDTYLQKQQKLVSAQQAGQSVSRLLYYLGIGLVAIGGFCYLATRSGED